MLRFSTLNLHYRSFGIKVSQMSTKLVKYRPRVIRDVLYGYIECSQLASQIIDTFEFQMLRQLRQLGITHYIYPSANHTRFEHSIGVYHLAGKIYSMLIKNQPELKDIEKNY